MTDRAEIMVNLWETALDTESSPDEAILLLCDVIAAGCNEIDANPNGAFDRIRESFDTLHITKHLGKPQ